MKNIGIWTVYLLVVPLLPAVAWSDGLERSDGLGHMWGGMIFGPLMMIVFVTFIVFFVVLVIRWLGGTGNMPTTHTGKTALDILDERFARGEIEKNDYEECKLRLST